MRFLNELNPFYPVIRNKLFTNFAFAEMASELKIS